MTSRAKKKMKRIAEQIEKQRRDEEAEHQRVLAASNYRKWSTTKDKWIDELITTSEDEGEEDRGSMFIFACSPGFHNKDCSNPLLSKQCNITEKRLGVQQRNTPASQRPPRRRSRGIAGGRSASSTSTRTTSPSSCWTSSRRSSVARTNGGRE